MKKEKHDRCLRCKSMDCAFYTCNVNKNYYSEYADVGEAKTKTKEAYERYDKKSNESCGLGLLRFRHYYFFVERLIKTQEKERVERHDLQNSSSRLGRPGEYARGDPVVMR